ncbi:MAG: ribonuclease Y [Nitrosarchaeum sp.]|nr:ribonuclease Y [Nitrosarchaeum sp.]
MNIDSQKQAILDVISLLKKQFDIKDDDSAVISHNLQDQQQQVESKFNELHSKELEFNRIQTDFHRTQIFEQQQLEQKRKELENLKSEIAKKNSALSSQERSVLKQIDDLKIKEAALKTRDEQLIRDLEVVANISKDEAITQLCTKYENTAKLKAEIKIKEIIGEATAKAQIEARNILTYAVQKDSTTIASNFSTYTIELPDESLKGKIIGREGRNVRAFEELTGVTVLIDDTPEAIVLSCYEPLRREIAKNAMLKLISDGRIHPQRIEEVVAHATQEVEDDVLTTGRNVLTKFQIVDMHNELVKALGRLKFRTSYSQNVLDHCQEVATISGDIAAELKYDKKILIRAGLLHDIGKSIDRSVSGSHAELGTEFARRYGESELICKLIAEHHDVEPVTIQSWIIKTADTLSSARPGVRQDAFDAYVKRLQDLEKIVQTFDGVKTSYAMMAGRELRVVVEPDQISDTTAEILSDNIKEKIEKTMNYPGQIKITVIREKRHIRIAL